jgi:polyphosphate kinase
MDPPVTIERTHAAIPATPAPPPVTDGALSEPRLYINRELSWLAFDRRVVEEAADPALPVLERLKFLGISSSNLDEFFMIRVAGLKQQLASGVGESGADGLSPAEATEQIARGVHEMLAEQDRIWLDELQPRLAEKGLGVLAMAALTAEQRTAARAHFRQSVFPALTPLAVDPGHPFPQLRSRSLNVAVLLIPENKKRKKPIREHHLAVVQVPVVLPRLVRLPTEKGQVFTLLDEVIAANAGELFPGYHVVAAAPFRVTRNLDMVVDEEDTEDLLSSVQEELRRRDRGAAVRLELSADANPLLERALTDALHLGARDVYRLRAPLNLPDLNALGEFDTRPELRVEPLVSSVPSLFRGASPVVEIIAKQDVVLSHPYENFEPVVRFIEEAADDPAVLAIKQTLYRTSGDSPFVRALTRAADNGKQVTVLVEIKARFDEANNIQWARRLEENGVHVVYGLLGLKTHCKVSLVVRREPSGIRRYVHLGTGNYNQITARQYTDISYFTARESIADDVTALFNMLTGYAEPPQWKRLAVAPLGLQARVIQLIGREADRARAGEPARILAKMNSLVDPVVIRALYQASQAGVEIELQVRGICCLRPGLPGVSERIRVTSVVDRFLEHSRIFAFGAGTRTELYLSSADWMPRNFHRRIEVFWPIEDPGLRARLLDGLLRVGLRDDVKARVLEADGRYTRVPSGATPLRSQSLLLEEARKQGEAAAISGLVRSASPQ